MIWIYDCEVTKYDWLFVFVNPIDREEKIIVNDAEELRKFYEANTESIFVGYNSSHYDSYIMKTILCGLDPYEMNEWIITRGNAGWNFSKVLNKIKLINYDTIVLFNSLKQLEAFQGHNIKESSIDFRIDRKLTPDELEEMILYCKNDTYETLGVFIQKKSEFDAHMGLIKEFKLPFEYLTKTKAQLITEILNAQYTKRDDEFNIRLPETLDLGKYQYIANWYLNKENHSYDKSLVTKVAGLDCTFSWGGLHASKEQYCEEGDFLMIDATSLYPTLLIQYNLHSRSIVDSKKYVDIYETNLRMKKEKNPARPIYKLICNTTYGCLGNPNSKLYDKLHANLVCIFGQLLLLDLCEKLENHCEIFNINTDGIGVRVRKPEDREIIEQIVSDFEKRSRLTFEYEEYKKVYMKDVNNYVMVKENGSLKTKGAYVKSLNSLDNNLPIINKAIVNYLVYKIRPEDTIFSTDDMIQFQQVFKVSGKYMYAMHGEEKLNGKCFRVFASRSLNDGGIFKKKNEDKNKEKFANSPDRVFIENGDITNMKVPRKLDRQWYIDLAYKRIKQFKGE